MTRTYIAGILDISKRKMVNSHLLKGIKDLQIHSNTFQLEIDYGLSLLLSSSNPQHKLYLRKPLCIELFEYAHCLQLLRNGINKVCKKVNQPFEKQGRSAPLAPLDRGIGRILNENIICLRDPRNKIAAHRYMTRSREFLTLAEINSMLRKISNDRLKEIKDQLFTCNEKMLLWLDKNKNFLVLAGKG